MPVATASTGGLGLQQLNYFPGGTGRQTFPVAGVNPGALAVDSVLAAFTIPANTFDAAGSNRGIRISAFGMFGATANNKTVKIIVNPATAVVGATVGAGGTTLVTTGVVVTNALPFLLEAAIMDVVGVNNEIGFGLLSWFGSAPTFIVQVAPSFLTADETKDILVAVTGNAATALTDIALNYFEAAVM